MKNLIIVSYLVLFFFVACISDKKNDKLVSESRQEKEYRQVTFEIRQGNLIPSEPDIKAISPSIMVLGQRMGYNIMYKKLSTNKDTLYFDTIFFAPSVQERNRLKKNFKKPSYYDFGMVPWGRHFLYKQQDICFKIGVSQFSRHILPAFIDSTERKKDWFVIFPYQIKGKKKCLIIYEIDSVFSKNIEGQTWDPIIDPSFKPDSLYHFP